MAMQQGTPIKSAGTSLTSLPDFTGANIWSDQTAAAVDGRQSPWSSSVTGGGTVTNNWTPIGTFQTVSEIPVVEALRLAAGSQDINTIAAVWSGIKAHPPFESSTLIALYSAAAKCSKLYRDIVVGLLTDIINTNGGVNSSTADEFSSVCCELGDRNSAVKLFQKLKLQRRAISYYHNLLRVAVDCSPAEMSFAVDILDEMARVQVPLTDYSIQWFLHGCCRTTPVSVDAAIALMDFRRKSPAPISPSILHKFLAVLEACTGEQAAVANRWVCSVEPQFLMNAFINTAPNLPLPQPMSECSEEDKMRLRNEEHYIIDVTTTNCMEYQNLRPKRAIVLFSTFRSLAERCEGHPPNHPCVMKLRKIAELLETKVMKMVPLTCELYCYQNVTRVASAPATGEKIVNFASQVAQKFDLRLLVITTDQKVATAANERNLRTRSTFAQQP